MEENPRRASRRDRARALRRTATEAERRLWWHLRRRLPLAGTYFRRQVALGPYFADFVCLTYRLIVELDGEQHGAPEAQVYDAARTAFLERQGFQVLRFWNRQVLAEIDSVLDTIAASLAEREAGPVGSARTLRKSHDGSHDSQQSRPSPREKGNASKPHTSGSASG